MIEFCSKKRMAIAILLLICSSIVILVLENKWSNDHLREAHIAARENTNETCKSGVLRVLEACMRCTRDELRKEISYCQNTGFKELVECDGGKAHFRGCDILPAMEQKSFWIFEGVCLGLGFVSYLVVYYRQRRLDNLMMEKINRQIASAM